MSSPEPPDRAPCACRGRRAFLAALAAGAAAGFATRVLAAGSPEWRLAVVNLHTEESLEVLYRDGAGYLPGALGRLDWLFRDHRASAVRPIDARLFDLLCSLARDAGVPARYRIISGYRSPATNAMLAARSTGVSPRSLHREGKAVDVRLVGVPLARLRDLALARAVGGVGYYPREDFVHLDVGRVRRWSG